ncbi:MAG: cell wall-binding repeat-containing protein [Peptostreptococcus porci]|uniref:cell wall-binding repeat-containing protein n=3 Tax=Peptostreptococcus porci TaxID=2652282 RepID=UPI002A90E7C3|nr:cell wall-binding repeat-containing protein [Peptostreptococcus porci]MDY5479309.1 cell wall-binding repeat-containing protein [Peptostreptococcus porci]
MKKGLSLFVAGAIVASGAGSYIPASYADGDNISRVSGSDRYETCVEICRKSFDKSNLAIITSGENYPDALSSGSLAAKYNAPLLLVKRDEIPKKVYDELKRLGVKDIKIVGGKNTISDSLLDELKKDYKVDRVSGLDRFETSIEAAKLSESVGKSKGNIFVNGNNFSDALVSTAIASKKNMNVILTDGKSLPNSYKSVLGNIDKSNSLAIGGKRSIDISGMDIEQIGGVDRYDTSKKVAEKFFGEEKKAIVASGEEYVDSLSSVNLAKKEGIPVLLSEKGRLNSSLESVVRNNKISSIYVIGGENTLQNTVFNKLKELLVENGKSTTKTVLTPIVTKPDKDKNGGNVLNPNKDKDKKKDDAVNPDKDKDKKKDDAVNPDKDKDKKKDDAVNPDKDKDKKKDDAVNPDKDKDKKKDDAVNPDKDKDKKKIYKDGVWKGLGGGFHNSKPERKMEVEITISNNKIVDFKLLKFGDDEGFKPGYGLFEKRYIGKIKEDVGIIPDLIDSLTKALKKEPAKFTDVNTGATYSNRGVVYAIQDALKQAEIAASGGKVELDIKDLVFTKKPASAAVYFGENFTMKDFEIMIRHWDPKKDNILVKMEDLEKHGIEINIKEGELIKRGNIDIDENGFFTLVFKHKNSGKSVGATFQAQKKHVYKKEFKELILTLTDGKEIKVEGKKDKFSYVANLESDQKPEVKSVKIIDSEGKEVKIKSFKFANRICYIEIDNPKTESELTFDRDFNYDYYNIEVKGGKIDENPNKDDKENGQGDNIGENKGENETDDPDDEGEYHNENDIDDLGDEEDEEEYHNENDIDDIGEEELEDDSEAGSSVVDKTGNSDANSSSNTVNKAENIIAKMSKPLELRINDIVNAFANK